MLFKASEIPAPFCNMRPFLDILTDLADGWVCIKTYSLYFDEKHDIINIKFVRKGVLLVWGDFLIMTARSFLRLIKLSTAYF